jgi:hypothetical protein
MKKDTLKVNQCLKVRWNIVLEEDEDEDKLFLIENQNKLGLALVAYWLEDDGFTP